MPPQGTPVVLGHVDSAHGSNVPFFAVPADPASVAGQTATPVQGTPQTRPPRGGDSAGDTMPPTWKEMDREDIWRGLSKGEQRPALDVAQAKRMMEKPFDRADARFS